MNPDTGHVVAPLSEEERKRLAALGYETVPDRLEGAARQVIADGGYATRRQHPQISHWAAHRRKVRRKIEKASRRANRKRR